MIQAQALVVPGGGHRPVSNLSAAAAFNATRVLPPPKRISQVEQVPGYLRGRAAVASSSGLISSLAASARPSRRPAAAGSFGSDMVAEVIVGNDDRVPVADPTESPWRHICSLQIESETGVQFLGTGWFIGPKTLMTAGHCVFLHDAGGWAKSITVIPALNGSELPYGSSLAKRFHATEGWTRDKDTNFDYGAIDLDAPFAPNPGTFGYTAAPDAELRTNEANIAGYPFDRDNGTRMYFHARAITSLSPQKLFYEIDTFGGQSGSPIFFNLDGERVAVGLHTSGSRSSNSGTRITKEVLDNMRTWSGQNGQPPGELPAAKTVRRAAAAKKGARRG
jgi:V8-like Glu-specific endopeptidase